MTTRTYRRQGGRRRRKRWLWHQQGGACGICGRPLGNDMTWDHIIPLSRGGADDMANLQLAHAQCNARKGNRLPA